MDDLEIDRMIVLASRAKTKVKQRGTRGICDLSFDEIRALAFIADVFLADYHGPLTRGDPNPAHQRPTQELETA